MQVELNPTALTEAVMASAEVKGYCADSPTMADKATQVNAFLRTLHAQMENQK